MDKMSKLYENEINQALPNGLSDKVLCTQGIWNKKKSVFTVSFINTRDLIETIESSPLCITNIFQNKSVAYF